MADTPVGLHLSCKCGSTFDEDDLTADECADILEIWNSTHDGVACRIVAKLEALWDKIKDRLGKK